MPCIIKQDKYIDKEDHISSKKKKDKEDHILKSQQILIYMHLYTTYDIA